VKNAPAGTWLCDGQRGDDDGLKRRIGYNTSGRASERAAADNIATKIHSTMISAPAINARLADGLSVSVPCKTNLSLQVLGRRDDPFHEIHSLVVGLDWCDELVLARSDDGTLLVTCDFPDLPTDGRNLVVRAAQALNRHCGTDHGATIQLEKSVPLGAGLGGGSADAAAALVGLNRLWQTGLTNAELADIGAGIGSDVPLFFSLPAALVTGRGDVVAPAELNWSGWMLLVLAGCEVSTRDVYAAWDPADASVRLDVVDRLLRAESADDISALAVNHLESAVFKVSPRVADLHRALVDVSPRAPRVSGAGQTVWIPFDTLKSAEELESIIVSKNIGTATRVVQLRSRSWMIE
jgi:4-diphosphocytidyl-2-C-methyl-D-erythritol kinase